MQRYDSYKDSGIQWLGEIPSHWEVCKTSYIFNHIGSGTTPNSGVEGYYNEEGTPFLQTGDLNDSIVINTAKKITDKAIRDSNQKIYPQGSLVIAMYGATIGKLGILGINATVNQACCVLPETKKIHTTYAYYLFLAAKKDLLFQSKGGGQPNISQEIIKNEKIVIPPLPEQQAIVSYLDTATAKIDEAIAQQQKMIDLLNERKQIIINNAVTKGLNPNAKMKPSGIDWIGNIPEHWKVCKIKQHCKVKTGKTPSTSNRSYFEDGNIKWFTPGDLNNFELLDSERKVTIKAKSEQACTMFPANTVFLVGIGGTIGKVGYCESEATCNQQINAISPNPNNVNHKYLAYFIQCNRAQIIQLANLSTLPIINQDRTGSLLFLVPPLYEQEEIVRFIEEKTTPLNESMNASIRKIVLLQERKQIIINDVVTGKVKVCNN